MQAFVWSNRFLIGVEHIDNQHRHLFEIVNQVGDMLFADREATPAEIEVVFRKLATYANTHFKDEEHLMRETGIDAEHMRHHVKSHRDFMEQVKAMWQVRTRMSAPAETLHGFLTAWLTYHILGEDQAMAREIIRIKDGMNPAEAHQLESGRGERSNSALLQALQTLYGVLAHMSKDAANAAHEHEENIAMCTKVMADANRDLQEDKTELTTLLEKVNEVQGQLLQSEKMASIGQLAAGVAHEINNPIGFVNSNLGTLGRYIDDVLQLAELGATTAEGHALKQQIDLDFLRTDLADLLRESQDGLDRVRKIVANLKDFSRVDQAEWQEADLLAGLESTLNVAAHELKYKAEIVRELQPLPPVRCVPAQINQVLLNLLVNAAQAIASHGTITLRSAAADTWVWIEVGDTGCGMDETTQRRIFEPFFTTKPVGSGTGLGMSLTYDIVKKHGGSIDVKSALGQGTRIRVSLPIAGPASAPPSA
jgi:two-component system, NtrC family, sensor kinase